LLASLHLLASCAVAAGMTDVTFQTLFHLLNDQNPLIRLLAHSDCVMTWKDAARVDLSFWGVRNEYEAYIRIVQQLQRPRRMRTLGEIVTEGMAGVGADRTVFLKTVAARLSGRIRRADGIGRPRLFTNVKPRIQRAILRVSPATLLTEVGEARFGPSDRQFTPRTRATRSA
jgi:hypothetical protein